MERGTGRAVTVTVTARIRTADAVVFGVVSIADVCCAPVAILSIVPRCQYGVFVEANAREVFMCVVRTMATEAV